MLSKVQSLSQESLVVLLQGQTSSKFYGGESLLDNWRYCVVVVVFKNGHPLLAS